MRWIRGVPVCGVLALFAACRGGGKDAVPVADVAPDTPVVHGRWRGQHDEVELFPSGRLLLHQGPYRVAGSYEIVEPGRMLLIYQNALAAVPPGDFRVAFTADSLTFCETDLPTRCVRYARVVAGAADSARAAADSASRGRVAVDDGTPPRLAAAVRPDQYPPEARSMEAHGVLKQAYVLQQTYNAMNGRYADTWDELREVGWQPHPFPLRHFHEPQMISRGDRLCIGVQPRAADLWPLRIGAEGKVERGTCR